VEQSRGRGWDRRKEESREGGRERSHEPQMRRYHMMKGGIKEEVLDRERGEVQ